MDTSVAARRRRQQQPLESIHSSLSPSLSLSPSSLSSSPASPSPLSWSLTDELLFSLDNHHMSLIQTATNPHQFTTISDNNQSWDTLNYILKRDTYPSHHHHSPITVGALLVDAPRQIESMRQGGEEGDDALSAVRGEGCESQAFNGGTLNADASALSSTDLKVNTFQDDPAGRLLDGNTKVDEDSPSTNTAARDTMTLGSPRRSTSHSPSLSSSRSPSQGSNATTASASPVYDATNVPAGVSQKVIPDWTLELIGDGDVVMAVVFSFLDVESIVHCERACSRWRSASMRHDEVVWLPHWIKMTLASSRTNAINNLALPTLRSNVLHHKRLQCNATAMASLFAGYGTIPVTGVESTHKLPGPAFGQNAGGKRHIQIVVGPGVVGGRGDQDETETQRAYFLSAHPVGLSSVDLLDPALTDMQTWDQQTTLPRVTRHLELSKRLCSMPTASGGKWVPVSAWTPGLSGVGESFFFLSTTVGGGTPLKTQFEGGSQDDLPASRRLIRSYSMPKFDDIRGVPFSRSEMGVDLKLDWESQSNRRILRLDLPIEYGDSVGCLNDDTFIVAFHSGLAVHAAESLGPFDDDQDPFDDFFSKKPITHSPPSSPFDKTTPPSSPSSSPRLRRKRSSSLLRRQLSTQSLTNLSPSPSSAPCSPSLPLPLLQCYHLPQTSQDPILLWSLPRPTSDHRIPLLTSTPHLLAHANYPIPYTPSNRFRERIQHLVDAHEATSILLRSPHTGHLISTLDLTKPRLWVRALHLTQTLLIVIAVQAPPPGGNAGIVDRHPILRTLLGRPPSQQQNRRGPQRQTPTTPPLSPLILLIFNLSLTPLLNVTINDILVPTEGCVFNITVINNIVSVYTHPPASLQSMLMGEGASEQDVWPTLPTIMRLDLENRRVRMFRRRAERFLMPNAGIGGGMRGDPGGMWVVWRDGEEGEEERCVWLRRPC